MKIEPRDFKKNPLTDAEVKKMAADGKRWSERKLKELHEIMSRPVRHDSKLRF